MHPLPFAALLLLTLCPATAQNQLLEGDFEQGGATWTLLSFNDPAGTTGFAPARVQAQGPSPSVFADFQTLVSVRTAEYRSQPLALAAGTVEVGFAAAWVKPAATPMPSPTVNRVELRIVDAVTLAVVQFVRLNAPATATLIERARLDSTFTVPAAGSYHIEIQLRHSNLAGIPFTCQVDDVYVGAPAVSFLGLGCAGSGGIVPTLHTNGTPAVGNVALALELFDAPVSSLAFVVGGLSDTSWPGGALPYALGGGCNLLVDPLASVAHVTTGSVPGEGRATQPLPIPPTTALAGVVLFTQWGVQDPASPSPLGFTTTAGMRLEIQP